LGIFVSISSLNLLYGTEREVKMKSPIKVSKKIEKLCRGLATVSLLSIGFPADLIVARVNESWPGYYYKALLLNRAINAIQDWELTGETTEEDIECWSS
jgi:hypothetical protein